MTGAVYPAEQQVVGDTTMVYSEDSLRAGPFVRVWQGQAL